jgi:transposase
MRQRRAYPREFKEEAVRMVTDGRMRAAEVARDLGLQPKLVGRWVREFRSRGVMTFPGNGRPVEAEVARLRREVEVLRQEREILKKAVSIFSHLPR